MSDEKKSGEKTLKTLIALAGFAIGATSVVAWNNRKVIQEKAEDAKERAIELKGKTIEFTESAIQKLKELKEQQESEALNPKKHDTEGQFQNQFNQTEDTDPK